MLCFAKFAALVVWYLKEARQVILITRCQGQNASAKDVATFDRVP